MTNRRNGSGKGRRIEAALEERRQAFLKRFGQMAVVSGPSLSVVLSSPLDSNGIISSLRANQV